ncbi:hypothetical protein RF11_15958 [Thelohanellus kitauei]|uniref:Uncharacterized protein n=1 Tax=Thelohanellus kitauei TaxID=669202 RepID=A0A0C2IM53_THEKT|nr:hypothetical protein RF11_15958 [Thelohanellus kitauei]
MASDVISYNIHLRHDELIKFLKNCCLKLIQKVHAINVCEFQLEIIHHTIDLSKILHLNFQRFNSVANYVTTKYQVYPVIIILKGSLTASCLDIAILCGENIPRN